MYSWEMAFGQFRRAVRLWVLNRIRWRDGDCVSVYCYPTMHGPQWRIYAGEPPKLVAYGVMGADVFAQMGTSEMAKKIESALERLLQRRAAGGVGAGRVDKESQDAYPLLVEMMTCVAYPDGSKRELSKVTVSFDRESGGWRGMLKDEGQGAVLWSHADTLQGLFQAIEQHLSSPEPDWREDRYAKQPERKKGR